MRQWLDEDWSFEVTVVEGTARTCRIGLETGDRFTFQYATPADFCPRAMADIHTWCEVIRCGGNFIARGSKDPYTMELTCPCGCIRLRLTAAPIHRDAQGHDTGRL